MQDLSSTQYFKVEKAPELKIGNRIQSDGRERIQSDQSDRGIHYVRRSDIYYKLYECPQSDHESGT